MEEFEWGSGVHQSLPIDQRNHGNQNVNTSQDRIIQKCQDLTPQIVCTSRFVSTKKTKKMLNPRVELDDFGFQRLTRSGSDPGFPNSPVAWEIS